MSFAHTWKKWLPGLSGSDSDSLPREPARFQTQEEVGRYVEDQLCAGLPRDWSYQKDQHSLQWRIAPPVRKPTSWGEDYILQVSGDYRLFIIYYGNAPRGCGGIRFSLWTAVVISSERLADCSLAEAVDHLVTHVDHFPLNIWSLT